MVLLLVSMFCNMGCSALYSYLDGFLRVYYGSFVGENISFCCILFVSYQFHLYRFGTGKKFNFNVPRLATKRAFRGKGRKAIKKE